MLRSDALSTLAEPFHFNAPAIETGDTYTFSSDSGVEYEVRFGRKKENILHVNVAFGVLNEEFEEEEYAITNRGELYRVMATVVYIAIRYLQVHPNVREFEFSGEPVIGEHPEELTKRNRLYLRYVDRLLDDEWATELRNNRVVLKHKHS